MVGAGAQELVQQIAVGGVDLHAVKIGVHGTTGGVPVVPDQIRHFIEPQCPGRRGLDVFGAAVPEQHGFCFGCDGRRRHGSAASRLQVHM